MAEGPNGQVDVGMPVVEVLDEDVVVIEQCSIRSRILTPQTRR